MNRNIHHPLDKALRIVIGLAMLALLFVLDSPARWWGLIGIVPILTVAVGWCPGYAVFAACGCKPKSSEQ
jgi:hypothetical protein